MALDIKDKIVFITGASSGIGKAAAHQFAEKGCQLILTARRIDKIKQLADELTSRFNVNVLPLQLDVQDKKQVTSTIDGLAKEWKDIDILVNNAGLALDTCTIQEGNSDNWDTMIDTNVKGLLYVTRAILPNMVSRNLGHIINIGSVAGQGHYPTGNVYSATKHAVNAITHSLRLDLFSKAIRVSEVDPGAVHTEFSEVRWKDKQRADDFYQGFDALTAGDIADAVVYCATRPAHVNIAEMQVFPTAQASCNHLHKEGSESAAIFNRG